MSGRANSIIPSSIIIVGGGASGVVMAAHLLKSPNPDLRVTLIEKRPHFGQGIAYSTLLSAHVLNVSAAGMSAYADDPGNFWRWLQGHGLVDQEQTPQTPSTRRAASMPAISASCSTNSKRANSRADGCG